MRYFKTFAPKIFLTFLIISMLIFNGCPDKTTYVDPIDDVIISPNVVVINKVLLENTLASRDSSVFTFNAGESIIDNLKVGNIIVSDSGKGSLRKVESINRSSDGKINVTTSQALITDAIKKGKINYHKTITQDMIDHVETIDGVKFVTSNKKDQIQQFQFEFQISKIPVPENSPVYVEFDGKVTFTVDIDIQFENDIGKPIYFKAGIDLGVETSLALKLVGDGRQTHERLISHMFLTPIVTMVGPVPVVFTPEILWYIGIDGKIYAGVQSVSPKFECGFGIKNENNQVGAYINPPSINCPPDNMVFRPTGGLELKTYLSKRFAVLLYGVVGPYLNTDLFLKLDVDLFRKPQSQVYAGIQGGGGASFAMFGIPIMNWSKPDILTQQIKIWESPAILQIMPKIIRPGDQFDIIGTGFGLGGALQVNKYVSFNDIKASDYIRWENDKISVKVPNKIKSGKVYVDVPLGGLSNIPFVTLSNEVDFTVFDDNVKITELVPNSRKIGDEILIKGENFGDIQNNSYIEFNKGIKVSNYKDWKNNQINVLVPENATSGNVYAYVNGEKSNGEYFTIIGNGDCKLHLSVTPTNNIPKKPGETYSYTIKVTKNDANGEVVPNVEITGNDNILNLPINEITDKNGEVNYSKIVPISKTEGDYSITFQASNKDNCSESQPETKTVKVVEQPPDIEVLSWDFELDKTEVEKGGKIKGTLTFNANGSGNIIFKYGYKRDNGTVEWISEDKQISHPGGNKSYSNDFDDFPTDIVGDYQAIAKFIEPIPKSGGLQKNKDYMVKDDEPPTCDLEVSVDPSSQEVKQGGVYSFDVKVTCKHDKSPVEGVTVEFNTFGFPHILKTDSEGVPKPEIKNWRVPGDQEAGNYQICFWASKNGYNPGSGCGYLVVKEELCTMMIVPTCPPVTLKVGDSHIISFIVKDQKTGQPIDGAKITLTNVRWLGTTPVDLYTDTSGYAEYSAVVPQGEEGMTANYTFEASKDGCTPTTIKRCYIYVSK